MASRAIWRSTSAFIPADLRSHGSARHAYWQSCGVDPSRLDQPPEHPTLTRGHHQRSHQVVSEVNQVKISGIWWLSKTVGDSTWLCGGPSGRQPCRPWAAPKPCSSSIDFRTSCTSACCLTACRCGWSSVFFSVTPIVQKGKGPALRRKRHRGYVQMGLLTTALWLVLLELLIRQSLFCLKCVQSK